MIAGKCNKEVVRASNSQKQTDEQKPTETEKVIKVSIPTPLNLAPNQTLILAPPVGGDTQLVIDSGGKESEGKSGGEGDGYDAIKAMDWSSEGIATLPGSTLKVCSKKIKEILVYEK